eukprot:CAMPEP_0113646458 /NCGR_PEP_ID=MMETSP0017_2-20120614/24542_1 /TAXON_ID=2856 /ORGANISM="Cylindrotheca closterium" /LENGTH=97 /DNA_ID=CAMNT_0000558357 /DNA_START=348 /DNA_END=641 /DNA_ORIENTATION=+ /assembly_acc=CAM_ASM_000147
MGKRGNDHVSRSSKEEYEAVMVGESSSSRNGFVRTSTYVLNRRRTPLGGGQENATTSANSAAFASTFGGAPDYHAIMVAFYQKHNPAKVADVTKKLE